MRDSLAGDEQERKELDYLDEDDKFYEKAIDMVFSKMTPRQKEATAFRKTTSKVNVFSGRGVRITGTLISNNAAHGSFLKCSTNCLWLFLIPYAYLFCYT